MELKRQAVQLAVEVPGRLATGPGSGAVAFIGAGSLAWNIVSGLLARGLVSPGSIRVCNRADEGRLQRFVALGVAASRDKASLLRGAGTVILATKPQDALQALGEAAPCLEPGTLLVSTVAGLPLSCLQAEVPAGVHVVRAMPNTSCQVGQSATAIAVGAGVPDVLVRRARELFGAVGEVYEVQEDLLDAITAVSGSGPAYFYFFTELLIKAAEQVGLETGLARELALQTLQGAAAMLRRPGADPAQLRAQVTSARGTTEAALRAMASLGLPQAFVEGVVSAARRSEELSAGFRSGVREAGAKPGPPSRTPCREAAAGPVAGGPAAGRPPAGGPATGRPATGCLAAGDPARGCPAAEGPVAGTCLRSAQL